MFLKPLRSDISGGIPDVHTYIYIYTEWRQQRNRKKNCPRRQPCEAVLGEWRARSTMCGPNIIGGNLRPLGQLRVILAMSRELVAQSVQDRHLTHAWFPDSAHVRFCVAATTIQSSSGIWSSGVRPVPDLLTAKPTQPREELLLWNHGKDKAQHRSHHHWETRRIAKASIVFKEEVMRDSVLHPAPDPGEMRVPAYVRKDLRYRWDMSVAKRTLWTERPQGPDPDSLIQCQHTIRSAEETSIDGTSPQFWS